EPRRPRCLPGSELQRLVLGSATSPRRSARSVEPSGTGSTPTSAARRWTFHARAALGAQRVRGRPGHEADPRARRGIEPWFMAAGSDEYKIDDDGWTIRSADGGRAAHVEHTIAVTDDGPIVLTAAPA